MNNNMVLCKCFTAHNKYYVYDAVKNCIIEVDAKTYKSIKKYLVYNGAKDLYSDEYNDSIKELIAHGFLQRSPILKVYNTMCKDAKCLLNRKLNFLILCVTHKCNLKCRYCNYASSNELDRNHEDINMSYKIAKDAIDFFLEHSCDSSNIDIGFYGGEPFLNWDVIKAIVNYLESLNLNKATRYSLTSNFTYLSDQIMEFIVRYNFDILISLDGPKEINDLQRFMSNGVGSFNRVMDNIEKLKKYNYDYYKEHVGINSVLLYPQLEGEVSDFFKEKFSDIYERITLNPADLSKIEYYNYSHPYNVKIENGHSIFNIEKRSADKISEILKTGNILRDTEYPNGQCIPGYERLFVDCDGRLFPCEKMSTHNNEANIGNIYTGFDYEKVIHLMNLCSNEKSDCNNCWAFRFCDICCVQFDSGICLDMNRKRSYCEDRKSHVIDIIKGYYINKKG